MDLNRFGDLDSPLSEVFLESFGAAPSEVGIRMQKIYKGDFGEVAGEGVEFSASLSDLPFILLLMNIVKKFLNVLFSLG